jgi:D-alanyl-D-alanine carboxypeptidase/D-alanyl-D-alanine-endopeptidase (penicillin-binding protein 4)
MRMPKRVQVFVAGVLGSAGLFAIVAAAWPAQAADDLVASVRRHLRAGEIAYVIDESQQPLVAIGATSSFVPASTLKVFTALLVREHLGLAGRFRTEFYLDDGWVVVRGFGDPYLVSEEITAAAGRLAHVLAGVKPVGVAVDDSYFAPGLRVPGVGGSSNPYDAHNSAFAVNFNTIHVKRVGNSYVSAEKQTPITPLAIKVAARRGVKQAERISIGHTPEEIRRYAAEVLAAKLREAGLEVGDKIDSRKAPADRPPVYVHSSSRTTGDCVAAMLDFSSNYIANQLFLAVGAAVEGPPATIEKSTRVARRFIEARPDLTGLVVTEGSGISRANKATAQALAAVLARFEGDRGLLPLEKGVAHKTGTLSDVRSLVGYLDSRSHGTVRFVIWLDGSGQQRRWRVLDELTSAL